MMLEWTGSRDRVLATVAELGRTSPDTVRGYRQLSDAGNKKDLLGAKTREWMRHSKHGATRDEIVEALGVAIAVNAGAALVYSTRVLDAYGVKASDAT